MMGQIPTFNKTVYGLDKIIDLFLSSSFVKPFINSSEFLLHIHEQSGEFVLRHEFNSKPVTSCQQPATRTPSTNLLFVRQFDTGVLGNLVYPPFEPVDLMGQHEHFLLIILNEARQSIYSTNNFVESFVVLIKPLLYALKSFAMAKLNGIKTKFDTLKSLINLLKPLINGIKTPVEPTHALICCVKALIYLLLEGLKVFEYFRIFALRHKTNFSTGVGQ